MRTCLALAAAGLLIAGAATAQDAARSRVFTVRGEVSSMTPLIGGYTVELAAAGGMRETAQIASDGRFEVRSSREGPQELRIVGPGGAVVHQETVMVNGAHPYLAIHLPDQGSASRAAGSPGTVSIQELQHKVPPLAKKAFDRGQQAAAHGNSGEALAAFREAISLDPEYADAYNELGAAEAAAGNLPGAAEAFQKAVEIAPGHPLALPNLSIVLAQQGKFPEAMEAARRALKIVPDAARIHYVLAVSILIEHGDFDEALLHLDRAGSEIPKAHLVAADVLSFLGRDSDAVKHIEEYLRLAPANDKERPNAEARLAAIRAKY